MMSGDEAAADLRREITSLFHEIRRLKEANQVLRTDLDHLWAGLTGREHHPDPLQCNLVCKCGHRCSAHGRPRHGERPCVYCDCPQSVGESGHLADAAPRVMADAAPVR